MRGEGGEIFVVAEQTDGVLEDVSLEVLGKAREIAGVLRARVVCSVLGDGVSGLAEELAARGADLALFGESPQLKDVSAGAYVKVLAPLVKSRDPGILLAGATHNGTTLAASLAVALRAGLMAHVVGLEVEGSSGTLLGHVPGFGGNIVAVCRCTKGRPQMATVRQGVFHALDRGTSAGQTERLTVELGPQDARCTVLERSTRKGASISRAQRVIVAGLGCRDYLSLPAKLAAAADATLAVTRPLADKGLAPREAVVGSTGSALNAKLAILLGASGAAHFVSGIRDVETVVAVNTDPRAPIFEHADYGVVGDASEILRELLSILSGEEVAGR